MKKAIIILALLTIALTSLAGCKKEEVNSVDVIKEQGYITMFTDARFAPFEYVTNGTEVTGVDIEIAKEIAKELGVELKITNADFVGMPPAIQNGQADMAVAAVTITEERAEAMDFSIPYTNASQYIIVQESNTEIKNFDNLAGKKIGVQLGTTGDIQVLDEINLGILKDTGAEALQYKTLQEGCLALANGKLDAVVVDDLSAKNYCMVNDGLVCFEALYADGSIKEELYGIPVKKGNAELLEVINTVVERLIDEGKIDEYLDTHIAAGAITE